MASYPTAIALTCIDGRVQRPVGDWLQMYYPVRYVDVVTEPGMDALLARGPAEQRDAVRRRALVSVEGHGSRVIAVVGHHDCLGNPVERDRHWQDIERGVATVRSWDLPVRVIGLWVNDMWWIEQVCER